MLARVDGSPVIGEHGRMSPETAVDAVRAALADAVRRRLGGADGAERITAVLREQGPRWFADDRPIRRVHSDASMFIGGMRALLLQTLHPLAMAGVAQHSDYKSDPWGRLQRTADFMNATTFGSVSTAEHAVDRVKSVHRRVRGVAPDGRDYDASDTHLLRWVHVAEVDSFLSAHDAYGARSLSPAERDGYVEDMAVIARALGVPAPPTTVRMLRDQLRGFRSELRGTAEAREATRYLLLSPPLPLAARAPYALLGTASVALLPRWARWPLRLPNLPIADAMVARPGGELVTRLLRWSLEPGRPDVTRLS
jgi:uncharacterized protein (DUF2236 family)